MPNKLTGDYEAMVQIAVRQINGLLAALHQNGVNANAPLQLVHSVILRVTPGRRINPDLDAFSAWVLEYQSTRPPAGIGGIRDELTTTAPPGAAHAIAGAFANLAAVQLPELTPLVVQGTVKAQVSNLTISMPPGSTSEVTVHAHVRAHYTPDPGTAEMPAPLHGEVEAAFRVRRSGAKLQISPSSQVAKIRFIPAPGTGLSPAEVGTISAQVRNVVRTGFTLPPVDLPPGFPFPEFKGVGSGGDQAIALPLQLSNAQPPPAGLPAVTDSIVGPSGFGFAVSGEFVLGIFQPTLNQLEQFHDEFTVPGVHIHVHFSVTEAKLQFNDGSIDLIVKAHVSPSVPGIGNIVVRQRVTLVLFLDTLFIAAPDDELHVTGAGPANSLVKSRVIAQRNATLPAAQNALNTRVHEARTRLEAALRSFDPAASVSLRAGHSEEPGASASGAIAITPEGVIIRGDIHGGGRLAPIVHVAETDQHRAFTALESWIPGGSIERLTWSWVEYPAGPLGGITPWSGVVKSATDPHGFILQKPEGVNAVGQVCLRIEGTQTQANGAVVTVDGGSTCIAAALPDAIEMPPWFEPVTVPIWFPDVAANAVLRDALAGHVSVQAHPVRADEVTHNSLVYFADWNSDRPLAPVADAISHMRRKRFSLLTIVVLPAGAFDGRRREVEARLGSIGGRFPLQVQLTEDDEGGWTRTFAAKNVPSAFLINARRQFVWKHEGPVDARVFAAALDEHLVPAPGPRPSPLRLTVAPGDRAPDIRFQEVGGDESALHRFIGRPVVLNFWQSWSAPCLKELRRLERLQERSRKDAVSVIAFHGGKTGRGLDEVRKDLRLSFSLVQDSEHQAARTYGVRCWPTTISINRDGYVNHIRTGIAAAQGPAPPRPDAPEAYERVRMLVAVSLLVPLLDQAVKLLLRRRLGSQAARLGVLGSVRVVNGSLWLGPLDTPSRMMFVWIAWSLSTVALVVVSHFIPSSHLFVGLLLGGSLSHGLEQSVRGRISDYICLRFWPAFNLADVALTVGAIGVAVRAIVAIVRGFAGAAA